MAVHVDQMVSDITTEPEPHAAFAGEIVKWQELERRREEHAQETRDDRRTEAEGYDD